MKIKPFFSVLLVLQMFLPLFALPGKTIFIESPTDSFRDYFHKVHHAQHWLKKRTNASPMMVIVLTAGVELPEGLLQQVQQIHSADIPHFPVARVQGHSGTLIFGKLQGQDIVVLKGRFHYYEGKTPQDVVFPYFVLNAMGAKYLISANSVGGIRNDLNVGDIMLITDHINALGDNPLRGIAIQRKEKQFPSMTEAYSPQLQDLARRAAERNHIELKEGVYIATTGPNFETKSEIKAFRTMGADVVGMSTVFETIACNFLEMQVLAFSGITNPAADRHTGTMTPKEVIEAMSVLGPRLAALMFTVAEELALTKE